MSFNVCTASVSLFVRIRRGRRAGGGPSLRPPAFRPAGAPWARIFVGQGGVAQFAQRRRGVGLAGQPFGGGDELAVLAAAAHVGVAIALDQAAAVDGFDGQRVVARRQPGDQVQPLPQARGLGLVAQRAAAEPPHAGQRVQHQEAAQRAALHAAPAAQTARDETAEGLGALQPAAQPGRQRAADFLQPRVHEFGGVDQLVRTRAHFLAHALEARAAGFQVGDADHVVVGHGRGHVARRRAGQRPLARVAAVRGVQVADGFHVAQIVAGVGQVLELDLAAHAGHQHGLRTGGEIALDGVQQGLSARAGGGLGQRRQRPFQVDGGGLRGGLVGCFETQREGAQAGLHAQAGAPHRGLEIVACERQRAAARHRAEQAGADDAAGPVGQVLQVEAEKATGRRATGFQHFVGIGDAVAGRGFFADGVAAVRRGQQHRALGRDQAALDRAPAFHQLGRHHQVHVARRGHQRQRRLPAGAPHFGLGHQLHVIDGGAGALGHAGHRSGLGPPAGVLGHVDDPVGQHAAALAAHGQDGDLDRIGLLHSGRVHGAEFLKGRRGSGARRGAVAESRSRRRACAP